MPRIRFTATPKLAHDLAHLGYEMGQEHDLPEDQANRWPAWTCPVATSPRTWP